MEWFSYCHCSGARCRYNGARVVDCEELSYSLEKQNPEREFNSGPLACPATTIICSQKLEVKVTWGVWPVLRLPFRFPTKKQGMLWTRRDSNPHLSAGQASVLPITPRARRSA